MSGSNYSLNLSGGIYQQPSTLCVAPSGCAEMGNFYVAIYPSRSSTACNGNDAFTLSLTRPMKSPGEVITLPNARVSLYAQSDDVTKRCYSWTGTVTWDSDVPSWGVTVDATCSETGKSGIKLVGTFSGEQ